MRSSKKIRNCQFVASRNTWALHAAGLLQHVSFINVFCTGDPLKSKELVFLTNSFRVLVMLLRFEREIKGQFFLDSLLNDFKDHKLFTSLFWQKTQDNNDVLAYWLSNASTLLLLLQRTLKPSGAAGMAPLRRRSSSTSLFGRMNHVK